MYTKQTFIAHHVLPKVMSAITEQKRTLTPTEEQIEKLKAQTNAKIAELKSVGIRADLVNGLKRNSSMTDDELYTLAKPFTNQIERRRHQQKVADGTVKKKGTGKKQ